MLVVTQALLTDTNDVNADCNSQGQCKAGVNVVGRRSPVYTNLRQHTNLVTNKDEHEKGDNKRSHVLASFNTQLAFHKIV